GVFFRQRLSRPHHRRWRRLTTAGRPAARIAHRALAKTARRLLDACLQFAFGLPDRANVLCRLRTFRRLGSPIELPGGDDYLFLRRHEIVDLLIGAAAAHLRLTLGEGE